MAGYTGSEKIRAIYLGLAPVPCEVRGCDAGPQCGADSRAEYVCSQNLLSGTVHERFL